MSTRDLGETAEFLLVLVESARRISLVSRDPDERRRAGLAVSRIAELAERMREYETDPSDEIAETIDALFAEMDALSARSPRRREWER